MKVPFLDLQLQNQSIKDDITQKLQEVIESCAFAGGPFVEKFENIFAPYCGCENTIGCDNGTAALWMALIGLRIEAGDEVITTPNSFIATAEAISFCGAKPVFVDVDKQTCNIDPALIEEAITPNAKAIIPVHLYGQMVDMDSLMEIAHDYNLVVIEDACQAHGAEYKNRRAGSIGDAGCFSFYPGKNLGAYGEAGAVVTNNNELSKKLRMFRDHGQSEKYYHSILGWNARMDGLQGAILSVKMKYIEKWTESRRKNAKLYDKLLSGIEKVVTPRESDYNRHVYHVYSIQVKNRESLFEYLDKQGISCGIHYPVPIHLQRAYKHMGYKEGDFPIAEELAKTTLSLPMFPELSVQQIHYVCEQIKKFYKQQ